MADPIESELLVTFLEFVADEKSDRTLEVRRSTLRKFDAFRRENEFELQDPPDKVMNQFISWVGTNEYADTYLDSIRSSVSSFYEWLEQTGRIEENPAKNWSWSGSMFSVNPRVSAQQKHIAARPDLEGREALYLSPEDVEKIASHAPSPVTRNELYTRLIWQSALRADEVSRIRIANVDFDKRSIRVRSAKAEPHHDHFHRYVYYNSELDPLLRDWFEYRSTLKHHDSEYLFITDESPQARPSHISRIVKRAAKEAGLNEKMDNDRWLITAHTLRHASITHLANDTDLAIDVVRKLAGHAQLSTTRKYLQTSEEERRLKIQSALR